MDPTASLEALLAHDEFVRALARSLVSDPHRADDVAQQTWLRAMRAGLARIDSIDDGIGRRGWFATVARRIRLDAERTEARRVRRERAVASAEAVVPSPEELLRREAARRAVVDAVLRLDPIHRDVIVLRWFEALPPRTIARRLGVSLEAVRSRLKRALAQLRTQLDADFGTRSSWTAVVAPLLTIENSSLTSWIGGALMQTKGVAAGIATAILVSIAVWTWSDAPIDPPVDVRAPEGSAAATETRSLADAVPLAEETRRVDSEVERAAAPQLAIGDDRPRAPLRGVVLDTDGRAVPFIEVTAISGDLPSWDAVDQVRTNADGYGRFAFDSTALPAWIVARDERRSLTTLESPRVLSSAAPAETDVADLVVRVERARTLVVHVTDTQSRPLEGAGVIVSRWTAGQDVHATSRAGVSRSTPPFQSGATANDGRVTFRLAPRGELLVTARRIGGTYDTARVPADANEVTLSLPDATGLTVRVVDTGGRPIPGAECLAPGLISTWTSTDARGEIVVTTAQPSVLAAPIVRARGYAVTLGPTIDTRAGATTIVTMEPERVIRGHVLDAHGEPLDGARVTVRGDRKDVPWLGSRRTLEQRADLHASTTSTAGAFEFAELYRGTFVVEVWLDDDATPAAFGVVRPEVAEIELRVGSRHALEVVFTGTVVDARTGAPVAACRVSALMVEDRFAQALRGVATADGTFALRALRSGVYRIAVTAPGYVPLVTDGTAYDAGEHHVALTLEPATSLRLRVVDRDERPVADAWLALTDRTGAALYGRAESTRSSNATVTDADGIASFDGVRAVPARVHVEHEFLVEPLDLDVPAPDAQGIASVRLPVELTEPRRTLTIDVRDAMGAAFDGMFAIDVFDAAGSPRLAWSGATFDDLGPRFASYASLQFGTDGGILEANALFESSIRAVERSGASRHVVTLRVPRSTVSVRVTRPGRSSTTSTVLVPGDEPATIVVRLPDPSKK